MQLDIWQRKIFLIVLFDLYFSCSPASNHNFFFISPLFFFDRHRQNWTDLGWTSAVRPSVLLSVLTGPTARKNHMVHLSSAKKLPDIESIVLNYLVQRNIKYSYSDIEEANPLARLSTRLKGPTVLFLTNGNNLQQRLGISPSDGYGNHAAGQCSVGYPFSYSGRTLKPMKRKPRNGKKGLTHSFFS